MADFEFYSQDSYIIQQGEANFSFVDLVFTLKPLVVQDRVNIIARVLNATGELPSGYTCEWSIIEGIAEIYNAQTSDAKVVLRDINKSQQVVVHVIVMISGTPFEQTFTIVHNNT